MGVSNIGAAGQIKFIYIIDLYKVAGQIDHIRVK